MAEVVYIAAAMVAPIVVRSQPGALQPDHHPLRPFRLDARPRLGAIQLFVDNAQEAYDPTLLATRLAEHPDVLLPVSSARTASRSRTPRAGNSSTTRRCRISSGISSSRSRCSTPRDRRRRDHSRYPLLLQLRHHLEAPWRRARGASVLVGRCWRTEAHYRAFELAPTRGRRTRRRRARLDRGHREGRHRRVARRRRAVGLVASCRSGRFLPPSSASRWARRRRRVRARPRRAPGAAPPLFAESPRRSTGGRPSLVARLRVRRPRPPPRFREVFAGRRPPTSD